MSTEISLEYGDVLKAYQTKSGELLTQLITVEAKLNASTGIIEKLNNKISALEAENEKLLKTSSRTKKSSTDNVSDYN
jgi:CII-binding regulator of phage lambda lysogenization HflD